MSDRVGIVVFDLGGVVVRICRSIQEAGRRVGIEIPDEDITPEKRTERKRVHAEYERGLLACDAFFERIALTTSGKYTPAQFRLMHEHWIIEEYPGVNRLIHDLHARGLETGVLSNTNASHWAQMQPMVVDGRERKPKFVTPSLPRHKHASHLLGLAKPQAEIYHTFAQRTGFTPSAIVFFDDLEDNVRAARDAGWHAHRIDHDGDTAAQMREHLRRSHGLSI